MAPGIVTLGRGWRGARFSVDNILRCINWCAPLVHAGRDAEVARAQLAAHLLDLQLNCKGTG